MRGCEIKRGLGNVVQMYRPEEIISIGVDSEGGWDGCEIL